MINHTNQQNHRNCNAKFKRKSLPSSFSIEIQQEFQFEKEITFSNAQCKCRKLQYINKNNQNDFSKEKKEIKYDNQENAKKLNSLKINEELIIIDGRKRFSNFCQNRRFTLKSKSCDHLKNNQSSQTQCSDNCKQRENRKQDFYSQEESEADQNEGQQNHLFQDNKAKNTGAPEKEKKFQKYEIEAPQYINSHSFFDEYVKQTKNIHFVLFFEKLHIIKRIAIRMADVIYDDAKLLLNIYMNNDECCCYMSERKKIPKKLNFNVFDHQQLTKIYDIICPDQADSLFIVYDIINFSLDKIEYKIALNKIFFKIGIFEKYLNEVNQIHQVAEKEKFDELEKQFIKEIQAK